MSLLDSIEDKATDAKNYLSDIFKKITGNESPGIPVSEGIGALAPGYLIQKQLLPAYAKKVLPDMFTDVESIKNIKNIDDAQDLLDSLKFTEFLKSEGYTLESKPSIRNNAYFQPAIKSTDNIKGTIGWGETQIPRAQVLAHEYGHAKNNELYRKLFGGRIGANTFLIGGMAIPARLGAPALGAVSTGATLLGNDDVALATGLAGLGAGAPLVAEETLASARGALALKKLGMGGKLKAFIGLPTYIMDASLPALPIFGKKLVEKLVEASE